MAIETTQRLARAHVFAIGLYAALGLAERRATMFALATRLSGQLMLDERAEAMATIGNDRTLRLGLIVQLRPASVDGFQPTLDNRNGEAFDCRLPPVQ